MLLLEKVRKINTERLASAAKATPPKSPDYSDFASLLTCSMCQSDFVDPLLLPCLHSACRECLEKYIAGTSVEDGSTRQIWCPSCAKPCKVPKMPDGVSLGGGFPPNTFVHELKAILSNRAKRMHHSYDISEVTANANKRLWNFTSRFTESGSFDREEVKAGGSNAQSKVRTSTEAPTCPEHPEETLDLYCGSCAVPVCPSCSSSSPHLLHRCRKLCTMGVDFDKELIGLTQVVEVSLQKVSRISTDLDNKERRMLGDLEMASQKVSELANKLRGYVDHQECHLQEKIRGIAREGVETLSTTRREVELARRSIVGLKSYTEGLVALGSLHDQAMHLPGLQQHVKEHDSRVQRLRTVRWEHNANDGCATLRQIVSMMGDVTGQITTRRVYWPGF